MPRTERQTLLCDADDTLWENNVYFVDSLVAFLDHIENAGILRATAEATLRDVEIARCQSAGYGSLNYALSLCETWEILVGPLSSLLRETFMNLGRTIFDHPIELLPEVRATLEELNTRHTLWIVTKGHAAEQTAKIARSGIGGLFVGHEVLPEKNHGTFADLIARRRFDPAMTWMIGNSPKSDMNPAATNGLRTIFFPHRTIWEYEVAALVHPPQHTIASFGELLRHF